MSGVANAQIPGSNLLGYGYNVFAAPYCDEDSRQGDANGNPLLNGLDFAAGDTTTVNVLGATFQCPNLFQVLSQQPRNDDYTIFASTVEEYSSQLTVTAHVGADIGGFSGSVDSNYQASSSSYLENVYGEHGHVYSGITVQLPLSAQTLRAHLKDAVRNDLATLPPAQIISRYGTHLVGGVVIGGKAFLRQYSSRSQVSDATEWSVALKASYDGVTAAASVDQKSSQTQQTFKMAIDVQTLGGTGIMIGSGDPASTCKDFQTWLSSVNGSPAIIDMTGVVPMWQLLAPGSAARAALQVAILQQARLVQPGALFGTMQYANNINSSETWRPGASNGNTSIGRTVTAGYGQCWNAHDNAQGNGRLDLMLSTGQESTSAARGAIYGGRQTASNNNSTAPFVELFSWGARHAPSGAALSEIVIFEAYTDEGPNGPGYSKVSLFVGPMITAEPGSWVIRGGHTLNDDGSTPDGWGLSPASNPTINFTDQKLCRVRKWDGSAWAMGTVSLYLEPVVTSLAELGGDD